MTRFVRERDRERRELPGLVWAKSRSIGSQLDGPSAIHSGYEYKMYMVHTPLTVGALFSRGIAKTPD